LKIQKLFMQYIGIPILSSKIDILVVNISWVVVVLVVIPFAVSLGYGVASLASRGGGG
jgi:hypothetical protein